MTVTIPSANDNGRFTFSGTAGERVSLNVTNVSIWFSYLSFERADGSNLGGYEAVFSSGKFIGPITLPVTATYTIVIDPWGDATGSLTMSLAEVPADATGTVTLGQPQTVTLGSPGQNARLTFTGTQNQRVFVHVSSVNLTPSGSVEVVDLLDPGNVRIGGTGAIASSGDIDTKTLTTPGTYTVSIDPGGAATGTTILTVYDVPPDVTGSISVGGPPVTVTTTTPGQDARLALDGFVGQPLRLRRTGSTFATSIVKILEPDSFVLTSTGITGAYDVSLDTTLSEPGAHTVLADGAGASIGAMTLTLANPEDDAGVAGADQSPATGDDTQPSPAAPQPVSPTGPVPPGSYTTEVWSSEDTGTVDGLRVVSSTAPATSALTGVVIDGTTSDPVPGATVTLTRGSEVTSTTTDGSGAYAFINMPPGSYDIDVSKVGYGLFTLANAAFDADEKYQETASLLASDQLTDMSQRGTVSPASAGTVSASDTYPSNFRPPPTLRVAMYTVERGGRRVYSCDKDDPDLQ